MELNFQPSLVVNLLSAIVMMINNYIKFFFCIFHMISITYELLIYFINSVSLQKLNGVKSHKKIIKWKILMSIKRVTMKIIIRAAVIPRIQKI